MSQQFSNTNNRLRSEQEYNIFQRHGQRTYMHSFYSDRTNLDALSHKLNPSRVIKNSVFFFSVI